MVKCMVRCGGLVVSVPATRSGRPGYESRPGGLTTEWSEGRRGRLLCEYCTKNYKTKLRLAVSKKKKNVREILYKYLKKL